MHNKLFIADNVLAVTGGRNLGDAYFGNDKNANFIDLDVLVAGRIVQDLSRSFDAYWNNERAYPVQSLVTRKELDKIREQARGGRQGRARTRGPGAAPPARPHRAPPRRRTARPRLGRKTDGSSQCRLSCGPPRSCWSTSQARFPATERVDEC